MKISNVAMLFGTCIAFATLPFNAMAELEEVEEDEDEDVHPLTNMPLASEFVTVNARFDEAPGSGLVMGELVGVTVGVINTHPTKDFNVTSAMGSLNAPSDFSYYVANFSQQMFTSNGIPVTIPPGQEASFSYHFYSPAALQVDFPYQMALSLFYEDDYEYFSDTFFNDSVTFSEPDLEWDTKSIVETTVLFGVAIYFYLYSRQAWSPQVHAAKAIKVDKNWAGEAIKERGQSRKVKR
mmetsp:Transcript_33854/g.49770  ORF Transcript_33854/g.49770 Transcript_33854/m.49770 type:complete len:238 (-) Transcript_33854:192-905(-)|eukprot:CAMPEP_0195527908 /NCGR_PEP_ID=MMETSP0794_2-20130614/29828_1 /TAXON_ID=515487 /ORGANISM="Stephanopyxis turris, Strain CCMP 815" /LENGTH=237 /DNA_ID=CAMNT_0040658927 /DNA_START=59 /DNA_END=772 /DNA_ORIENTATION=+